MKRLLTFFLVLICFVACIGCSDMIQSLQAENAAIDRDTDSDSPPLSAPIQEGEIPSQYRPQHTLAGPSANNTDSLVPPVRRAYSRGPASVSPDGVGDDQGDGRKRREDFQDKQAQENSLWDAQGQTNYLFTNNRRRETGDLITVDVEKALRREIQYKLWQTLPPEERMPHKPASEDGTSTADGSPKKPAEPVKSAAEKGKDAAEEAAKANVTPGKDDDLLRMEVVENMDNGMVRVSGQKRVIYHSVAHSVQVTALVNAKDIDDQNHLKSSSFLDMQTQVVQ